MTDDDAIALRERERVRVLELVVFMLVADLKKRLPAEARDQIAARLQGLAQGVSSPEATALLSTLSERLE